MRVSFDVGGTFTDIALVDDALATSWFGKSLTTHEDVSRAIRDGVTDVLAHAGVESSGVSDPVVGATTLVTNALIERTGGPTALVTTRGFADVVEIGREIRYDLYDLRLEFPAPLVPRERRFEISERMRPDGTVETPLATDELPDLVEALRVCGARSIAVCFLHSYANPLHEKQVQQELERALTGVGITCSYQIAPEIREVERLNTTVADAYVRPVAGSHLWQIESSLEGVGISHGLHLMQSNGGIIDVRQASEHPIYLLESGPAAGALGASYWGRVMGVKNLISFDMGGTTAKVCMVDDFQPSLSRSFEVARIHRFKTGSGITIRVPVIELLEIGAGGGSIARIDEMGLLKVGPTSAGSEPGPACYGRGGRKPTITDADLVLGYLDPDRFLGGRMTLDVAAAEQAISDDVANALGSSVIDAAAGIVRVVDESMALAARVHATERGRDPRDYEIFAFGGAGPLHASALARILGVSGVIVPAAAGVLSATGLHVAVPSVRLVQTHLMAAGDWKAERVDDIYSALIARATEALSTFSDDGLVFEKSADIRFVGQGFEIEVELPIEITPDVLTERFCHRYKLLYGSLPPNTEPEVVSWRLAASAPRERSLPRAQHAATPLGDGRRTRQMWFPDAGWVEALAIDHGNIKVDEVVAGPAVVHQAESTVVVGPEDAVRVDEFGNLRISIGR